MKTQIILYFTSIVFLSICFKSYSQDKLYFVNGKVLTCNIIALSQNTITYKDTTISGVQTTIPKNEVLIAEYKTGEIYIFGGKQSLLIEETRTEETKSERFNRQMKEWKEEESKLPNGILGCYLAQFLGGRFTISYERLFANKTLGITVPVSLTYNILSRFDSSSVNRNNRQGEQGVGFISGLDINYYHAFKPKINYFFGPRFRYGKAMTFGGIEYLSFQIQNGVIMSEGKKVTNTISFGVGFFKLSKIYANLPGYEPNQVYPTMSLNWRIGLRL